MFRSQIVYIIGFMGSGKSTAGKKLASLLGWSFIDLDKEIEEKAGMKIPKIFSVYGEEYFRSLETKVLRTLGSEKETLISTGGGTPCYDTNMDFMLDSGLTVYLKMTPEQLHSRLSESMGERPLIKDFTNERLFSYIKEKLAYREKWYNRSDITIEGLNIDICGLHSLVKANLNI
jgi:shikimate kinase